jgi:hypothetical protein
MSPELIDKIELQIQEADSEGESRALANIGRFDPDRSAIGGESLDQLVAAGKDWWQRHETEVKSLVCKEAESASSAVVKTLIEVVFGALSLKYGGPLATYVSVLAIRKILAGWCTTPAGA